MEKQLLFEELQRLSADGSPGTEDPSLPMLRDNENLSVSPGFYEGVIVRPNETVLMLAAAYGYNSNDWRKIWKDPKNAELMALRKTSDKIRPGDKLWIRIPWKITASKLTYIPEIDSFQMEAIRDGQEGDRLNWTMTYYLIESADLGGDAKPNFYLTNKFRTFFHSQQTLDLGEDDKGHCAQKLITKAGIAFFADMKKGKVRMVTSLSLVNGHQVSVWNSLLWGIYIEPGKKTVAYPIRRAGIDEINTHLDVLRQRSMNSDSKTKLVFKSRDIIDI